MRSIAAVLIVSSAAESVFLCSALQSPGSPLDFIIAEHRSPALRRAAVAVCIRIVAVAKVVLIGQLFADGNIPNGDNKNPPLMVLGLAIRIARVIDKHRRAKAINNRSAIAATKKISDKPIFIALIGDLFRKPRTLILADPHPLFEGPSGIAASRMNRRGTNNKTFRHELEDFHHTRNSREYHPMHPMLTITKPPAIPSKRQAK